MVREGGMARTPYSSTQDIQMDVLDNAALQVTPPGGFGGRHGGLGIARPFPPLPPLQGTAGAGGSSRGIPPWGWGRHVGLSPAPHPPKILTDNGVIPPSQRPLKKGGCGLCPPHKAPGDPKSSPPPPRFPDPVGRWGLGWGFLGGFCAHRESFRNWENSWGAPRPPFPRVVPSGLGGRRDLSPPGPRGVGGTGDRPPPHCASDSFWGGGSQGMGAGGASSLSPHVGGSWT